LFVQALFRLEVPEIQQEIVQIQEIAREVGSRTKVAVVSRDDSIDPVGACVGLKGSRVQAVVNELGSERIDIVPWSPDPERFARLALAPARVTKVYFDHDSKTIQAIVDEDQLSLAIGRGGQNVRLASELTGWKIDLYSSREWLERGGEGPFLGGPRGTVAEVQVPLSELAGLLPDVVAVLEEAGLATLDDLLSFDAEKISEIPGMDDESTGAVQAILHEMTKQPEEDEPAPVQAQEAAAEDGAETEEPVQEDVAEPEPEPESEPEPEPVASPDSEPDPDQAETTPPTP
jgi:N utilization substance protein A